jgi:hypothetical protein
MQPGEDTSLLEVVLGDGRRIWSNAYCAEHPEGSFLTGRSVETYKQHRSLVAKKHFGDWNVVSRPKTLLQKRCS